MIYIAGTLSLRVRDSNPKKLAEDLFTSFDEAGLTRPQLGCGFAVGQSDLNVSFNFQLGTISLNNFQTLMQILSNKLLFCGVIGNYDPWPHYYLTKPSCGIKDLCDENFYKKFGNRETTQEYDLTKPQIVE